MELDENTKYFLVSLLKEETVPMGGGIGGSKATGTGGQGYEYKDSQTGEIKYLDPSQSSFLDNPIISLSGIGTGDTEQKQGESDEDYKKRIGDEVTSKFKGALEYSTGFDFDEMPEDQPSLEYLAALGTIKRSLGWPTNPSAGSELMDFGPARTKTGDIDWSRTLMKPAGRAVSYGLAKAALNTGMGEIGRKLSGKINYLTALGVDPFDYATKVMGVDYVADQLAKLPARQKKQITAGQGNIAL